jgi:hypothetical protein
MARRTSTGHRKLGQRLSWGEPSSQFKVWTAPRLAVPAKRKTALRMAFSKCNLETPSYAVTPSNWDLPALRQAKPVILVVEDDELLRLYVRTPRLAARHAYAPGQRENPRAVQRRWQRRISG